MPSGSVVAKVAWAVVRTARLVVHYPSWLPFLAVAALIGGFDPFTAFLAAFLGVYVLYLGRTGLGVLLKLGSPRFYDRAE